MNSSPTLIEIKHVSRFYGPIQAVKDISFTVHKGEVLGFLGPNGAGKSTTMQMITGNLAPSLGSVRIHGIDILDQPKLAKAELGYLPEQPPVYRELTVDEFLQFCARLNRITPSKQKSAVARAKERCGLTEVGRRLIGNLSKGYKQRVGIAQAIIHSPAVVILDEPTVGLDPIQIRDIRNLIRELGQDHSVILSTHILPEVQSTCTRVLIINKGELVLAETTAGLQRRMQSLSFVVAFYRPPEISAFTNLAPISSIDPLGEGRFRVHHTPETNPAESIAVLAAQQNWGLYELVPDRISLEEIFVNITCKEDHAHEHTAMEAIA